MRKTLSIGAFLIQPFALYLQVRNIVENKGFQLLFYILGGALLLVGIIVLFKEEKKRRALSGKIEGEAKWDTKEPILSIVEGFILLLAPVIAMEYVKRIDRWAEYAGKRAKCELYTDLLPNEKCLKALDLLSPDKMEVGKAFNLAKEASENNCPLAFDLLGQMYMEGFGCAVNYELAAFNFAQAAMWGVVSLPERMKEYPELRNVSDEKIRKIIQECEENSAVIDSINTMLLEERATQREVAVVVDENRQLLEQLSEKGYIKASVLLYIRAIVKSDSIEVKRNARRLMASGFIPDYPYERAFFFQQLQAELPRAKDGYNLDEVSRWKENEDFYQTLTDPKTVDILSDSLKIPEFYSYARSQFRRIRFLKQNERYLHKIFMTQENIDAYYSTAESWYRILIREIENIIATQPLPDFVTSTRGPQSMEVRIP